MARFVCQSCESEHGLRVTDLIVTACCELCGVLRGDWGWKRVAMTACHLFSPRRRHAGGRGCSSGSGRWTAIAGSSG